MRGHIRKRSDNSWTVVVDIGRDPETKKRRQKWVTVHGTKKEAEKVLAELLVEANQGKLSAAPAELDVGRYLEQWLAAVETNLKPSTAAGYKIYIGIWQRTELAQIPLAKLSPLHIQKALSGLMKEMEPTTCRTAFAILRAALKQAAKWGYIPQSPTDGVKAPPNYKKEMQVWTEEEAVNFLKTAKNSVYYPLFALALATGMRLGELLGLKWEDVDLEAGAIRVRRTLAYTGVPKGEVIFLTPKTAGSTRRIPVDRQTVEILKGQKKSQAATRLKAGEKWHDYGLVFTTKEGRPSYHANVRSAFKKLACEAGVPLIRLHDLRHTHATFLLRKGIHPKIVAERLGHSSVKITLDTYSHLLPDTQAEAARVIESIFGR